MADGESVPPDDGDSVDSLEADPPFQLVDTQLAFETDRWFFRMVAISLGAAIVFSVAGSIWLAAHGNDVPESVVAIGSASVGALAGVLTVRRSGS